MEKPGCGRGGKPNPGVPPRPQTLEIANPAIPTFPQPRRSGGKVESQKTASHFPTARPFPYQIRNRKEAWRRFASLPPPGSFFN
jgi:hypothetical protein